jgi:large subunit ribosomal protein L23
MRIWCTIFLTFWRECFSRIINFTSRYPLYHVGNPQLRVFLPNFTMTLLKPFKGFAQPPNVVNFKVSLQVKLPLGCPVNFVLKIATLFQMTQLDVKNYLEKIYKVPVINVKTINIAGNIFTGVSPY